jgi:hypothetical protein
MNLQPARYDARQVDRPAFRRQGKFTQTGVIAMSQLIETLEQRQLMSASVITLNADRLNLNADATSATVVRGARDTGINNAITALAGDLKNLDTTENRVANNRLIAKLRLTAAVNHLKVVIAQNIYLATARVDAAVAYLHGAALIKHPTSVPLQKLVARDITNLTTGLLATRLANYQAAIVAANPSVSGTVTNGETNLQNNSNNASAAATTVQGDAAQLATDLSTLVAI